MLSSITKILSIYLLEILNLKPFKKTRCSELLFEKGQLLGVLYPNASSCCHVFLPVVNCEYPPICCEISRHSLMNQWVAITSERREHFVVMWEALKKKPINSITLMDNGERLSLFQISVIFGLILGHQILREREREKLNWRTMVPKIMVGRRVEAL